MKIVLVDQLCFAPVALTSFYVGLSALELKSVEEIKEEWKSKFPKTWAVRQNMAKEANHSTDFFPFVTDWCLVLAICSSRQLRICAS